MLKGRALVDHKYLPEDLKQPIDLEKEARKKDGESGRRSDRYSELIFIPMSMDYHKEWNHLQIHLKRNFFPSD